MISIITPHYNGSNFHEHFFNSLIKQTFIDWELIVVDDCSDKPHYLNLKKKVSKDSRFNLFRNESNKGVSFSRNKGLSKAKGSFIAFLDIDDIWHIDKLNFQYNIMINDSIDFCCTAFTIVNEKSKILGYSKYTKQFNINNFLKFNINIACSSVMLRKESIITKFDESMSHAEDYLFWGEILNNKKFNSFLIKDPKYLIYLKSINSLSSNKFKQLAGVFKANYKLVGFLRAFYFTPFYIINSLKRLFDLKTRKL